MNLRLAALLVVLVVGAAITLMYLVRKRAPDGGFFSDSDRAAAVFGVIGTSFAVLLAFVIFLAFESYGNARQEAGREADSVLELAATTRFFPEVHDALQGELICYARSVIELEWPAMKHQDQSEVVEGWVANLETDIERADVVDERQSIAYSHWFEKDAVRQEARRARLAEASPFVPRPLWIVLLLGGVLVLTYMLFYADSGEREIVQALMIGSVTAVFAASLLFVNFLDHPYENTYGSIKPVDMVRTLERIERTQQRDVQSARVPCDERGRPIRTS